MRIVLLASGAFAIPTLRWLVHSEHEVALIVTQPARRSGRGRRITPTPVQKMAGELNLQTLEAENVNAPDVVGRLCSFDARLGLVIAFGQKIGPEMLGAMPGGYINLHASLLPKYRGAAPIQWAITREEEQTGCTVFRIVERMDSGPILTTRWTAIKPEETAGELHDRLAGIGVDAVDAALQLFEGNVIPEGAPQDEHEATYAPKLKKSDGLVRFDRSAASVARHICGMTPWPGAAARYESADGRWEKVLITRARRAEDPCLIRAATVRERVSGAPGRDPTVPPLPRGGKGRLIPPGTIDERRYVAASDGFVEILEIQPSSGRNMTWVDYVNGRHVVAGDRLVTPGS